MMTLSYEGPILARVRHEMDEAERRAWEQLGGGRFMAFARCVDIWMKLNTIGRFGQHNPFNWIVEQVKGQQQKRQEEKHEIPRS